MKRLTGMVAVVVAGVLGAQGWLVAQAPKPTPRPIHRQTGLSDWDRSFITRATQGGIAEVRLGRLAAQRAGSTAVKQFGRHMVHDHSKANAELSEIAAREGMSVPRDTNAARKAVQTRLARLSGAAFDRLYMQEMVKDHANTIALFREEATKGTAPNIKAWAINKIPALQKHLQMAQALNSKIQGAPGRGVASSTKPKSSR